MEKGFVHLHLHSEYSLLDGACRISEIPAAVKRAGQNAVAITDHGVMYGVVDFYKECKKNGVKPIIGCEIYVAPSSRFSKDKLSDSEYSHLILLCKDRTGYENLIKIVSKAYTEGFYAKPRADIELLREHSEGLICLSACLAGYIPRHIVSGDIDGAKEYAKLLKGIYGSDNFYLEMQDHGIREQAIVNAVLCEMSKELDIPLAATNDVHYIDKEDSEIQDILMCIQMNKTLSEKGGFAFETKEFYLKDTESMYSLFSEHPEALENTVKISEKCNFEFEFDKLFLPAFYPPDGKSCVEYLRKLCYDGFERRISEMESKGEAFDRTEYEKRLEHELEVVISMGYAEYYLIVNDFISYAKSKGIPVGPGRGSGAGSLAAYCLGITDVDPIKYDLLFERFLNPERVSMPDFDVDFCYERRQEVIEYVAEKYGRDHVAQIVTFGTMAARAAIRDVGRVLGISYSEVDSVAKNIPFAIGMTIDKAMSENSNLSSIYENDLTLRHVIDVAKRLEGMPRHASVHAAGVVITDKPVDEYVPLAANRGSIVTQFTMNTVADLGLLKIDFLGLRYLTVISDAEKDVQKNHADFDIKKVDISDPLTYKLISSGKTDGVFQLESKGMKSLLTRLKPVNIEDITAAISLYRPGPMDSIPRYLENRKNPDKIEYKASGLEEILSVTNGCIVYQEQVMQIFRKLAGYSYGRADIVRRAMSKKKQAVMDEEREYFLHGKKREDGSSECEGAIARGVDEKAATELYDEMSEFAKYAFNKSHAACYAVLSFRTAYLKAHYPKEYMCALLTSVLDRAAKVALYIEDCKSMGIKVLPPDINRSFSSFCVEGDNIRFGLLAVKNVGRNFINQVVEERKNGDFTSLEDFLTRMPQGEINKHMLESLIKCGAFDTFGKKRSQLLAVYESAIEALQRRNRLSISGQYDMFSMSDDSDSDSYSAMNIDYPDLAEMDYMEKLAMEKEIAGIYISGHPLERYSDTAHRIGTVSSDELYDAANPPRGEEPTMHEKDTVKVLGMVASKKVTTSKNGKRMAFVNLEDVYGNVELIVFPNVYETLSPLLEVGKAIVAAGELSFKDTNDTDENGEVIREAKILVSKVVPVPDDGLIADESQDKAKGDSPGGKEVYKVSLGSVKPYEFKTPTAADGSAHGKKPTSGMPLTDADGKKLCLFLKIDSSEAEEFERTRNLLEIFSYGAVPTFIYFADTKKTLRMTKSVQINETMLTLLREILGQDSVKTVYRNL